MSAFKPGDVVRVGGMLAFYTDGNEGPMFTFADGSRARADVVPADPAHPLAVIDPASREQVERLLKAMQDAPCELVRDADIDIHRGCLAAALREFANPKPPKPEEPTGLGAVVEDAEGLLWVRVEPHNPSNAVAVHAWRNRVVNAVPRENSWSRIDAVRVLSEGVVQP